MVKPLVTVICVCYNHREFVREAILSALSQSYDNIELIVADDGSSDGSAEVIDAVVKKHQKILFMRFEKNLGYCRAFNRAFARASGEYIIDLSADDVLLPDKLKNQLNHFQKYDNSYGVTYSNAVYIDRNGNELYPHFGSRNSRIKHGQIPEGDIYKELLESYFIPTPTMIVRSEVLQDLRGYDEALAYEDFDFWVRSSRRYKYAYFPEITMNIRRSPGSLSQRLYNLGDKQLYSTYIVCKKASHLNKTQDENLALTRRIKYEARQALLTGHFKEADLFLQLADELGSSDLSLRLLRLATDKKLHARPVWNMFYNFRNR